VVRPFTSGTKVTKLTCNLPHSSTSIQKEMQCKFFSLEKLKVFISLARSACILKLKRVIRSKSESVEDTCILKILLINTLNRKAQRLKEGTLCRDSRTSFHCKRFLLSRLMWHMNKAQLDRPKEEHGNDLLNRRRYCRDHRSHRQEEREREQSSNSNSDQCAKMI